MKRSDDELLKAVRDALVPPEVSPGNSELARFYQALAAGRSSSAGRRSVAWRSARVPPVLIGVGTLLVGVLGAFGGGVAANSLPGPLRSAAYDIGLPVSSPALVAVQSTETELRSDLHARARAAVVADVGLLQHRLAALDPGDSTQAEPGAESLLAEADAFLATTGPPSEKPPGSGTTEQPEPNGTGGSDSGAAQPESSTTQPPESETSAPAASSDGAAPSETPSTTVSSDGATSDSGDSASSSGSGG